MVEGLPNQRSIGNRGVPTSAPSVFAATRFRPICRLPGRLVSQDRSLCVQRESCYTEVSIIPKAK
jgi:hypothetical protein